MLLSMLALSILFIPFTLTEAAWRPPVLDTHAQYGLNLTFAGWLKSSTVRYIQATFGSPEQAASTAHTRQIRPKEARFCEAAYSGNLGNFTAYLLHYKGMGPFTAYLLHYFYNSKT